MSAARECSGCSTLILPGSRERNKRKWCSESCRVRSWAERNPKRIKAYEESAKEKKREETLLRNQGQTCRMCGETFSAPRKRGFCGQTCVNRANAIARRARHKAVPRDSYTPQEVLLRSGGSCGLCGLPILQDFVYPDRRALSVDHIVPLARGGTDEFQNVQASHLGCNWSKGARVAA